MVKPKTENVMTIKLFNGAAFPVTGTNFTIDQIHNHCKLTKSGKNHNTGDYSSEEKADAKAELLLFRQTMSKRAATKFRSRFVANMKVQGNNDFSSIEDVSKAFHGPKPTLKLVQQIYAAIFSMPEKYKESLLRDITNDLLSEFGVIFCEKPDKENHCIVCLVQEALYTARKVFMKSGRLKGSQMYLSSRQVDEWKGPINHCVGMFEFGYHKVGGWQKLKESDPEARAVYFKFHPEEEDTKMPAVTKTETAPSYVPGNLMQKPPTMFQNGHKDSDTMALVSVGDSQVSTCFAPNVDMEDYFSQSIMDHEDLALPGIGFDDKSGDDASSIVSGHQRKILPSLPPMAWHNSRNHPPVANAAANPMMNHRGGDRSSFMLHLQQNAEHTMSDVTDSSKTIRDLTNSMECCREDVAGCRGELEANRNEMAGCRSELEANRMEIKACRDDLGEFGKMAKLLMHHFMNTNAAMDAIVKYQRQQEHVAADEANNNIAKKDAIRKVAKGTKTEGLKRPREKKTKKNDAGGEKKRKKAKNASNTKNGKQVEDDDEFVDKADDDEVGVPHPDAEEDDEEDEEFDPDEEPLATLVPREIEGKQHTTRATCKQGETVGDTVAQASNDDQVGGALTQVSDAVVPEKVLNSSNNIEYLAYFHKVHGESHQIKIMDELHQAIATNKADPTKGCPEELIWVVYKHKKSDKDVKFQPWTEIVLANQRSMVKTWLTKRKKLKRGKDFPLEVEDHAAAVFERLYLSNKKKHEENARKLQEKWEGDGLLDG